MKTIAFIVVGILQIIAGFLLGLYAPTMVERLSACTDNLTAIVVVFFACSCLLLSGIECLFKAVGLEKGGEK